MTILLLVLLAFTLLRLGVAAFNGLSRQWLRPHEVEKKTTLSILIPARNEAGKIGRLLKNIVETHDKETHDNASLQVLEILVYDDQSDDGTDHEVLAMQALDPRIRLIRGGNLPEGWLGKNHACHRLGEEASGDWLLFLDADVNVRPELFRDSVGFAVRKRLQLVSLFPVQKLESAGEWLTVPLMNHILVSLLPMRLVRTCRWTSFAGANGQFMLFEGGTYKRYRWHEQVKSDPVEDIRISRLVKKRRLRTATLLSGGQISCRMYENYGQAVRGFSKNIAQFFGNSIPWMLTYTLLTTLLPLSLILAWLIQPIFTLQSSSPHLHSLFFLLYLLASLFLRLQTSLLSRQNPFKNLLYWIPQQAVLLILVTKSIRFRFGQKIVWKGRAV